MLCSHRRQSEPLGYDSVLQNDGLLSEVEGFSFASSDTIGM